MRREWLVIGGVIAAALIPMWTVGAYGETAAGEMALDYTVSEIYPLDGFLDTPEKLSPSQVGVIVWIALLGMFGAMVVVHRFMQELVRPEDGPDARPGTAAADGGERLGSRPASERRSDGGDRTAEFSWLTAGNRRIVAYEEPSDAVEGLVAMGGLTVLAIVFAALFTGEYLTLARTQYFGLYAAGMFLALALSTVAYYAWFMPHVEVAERRHLGGNHE